MKRILALLLALGMLLFMFGCNNATQAPATATAPPAPSQPSGGSSNQSSGGAPQEPSKEKYLIGYSSKTQTNDAFQIALAGTVKAAVEAAGHECIVVQTDSGSNPAQQTTQVEDLINRGIDGMILNVCDPTALVPALEQLKNAGIPTICVDGRLAEEVDKNLIVTYIGVNNLTAATNAAKFTAEYVGGEGDAIIIGGRAASLSSIDRVAGFNAGLEGTNIKVVAEQAGDYDNDTAMQVMENLLQQHAATVDMIFLASDVMLDGTLQAIDNHGGVNPDVVIMSYDGSAAALEYLEEGRILGSCAQFPKKIGTTAVENLLKVMSGEADYDTFGKYIDTGTEVIYKDNLADYMANWAY